MALTADDLAYLRSELGVDLDEADMEARLARLGSTAAVANEVVRERLAAILKGPTSFSIPGVYSESRNDATIKALQEQAARLQGVVDAAALEASGASGASTGKVVRTDRVR